MVAAALSAPSPSGTVDVPVLARSVEKGEMLGASDFTQAPLPVTAARGAVLPDQATGREAVRPLRAGNPVRASDLVAPRVIRRGQSVTILLTSGALSINAAGRALTDAGVGETVRVLNLSSNRTIEAIADEAGRARVTIQ
jgi:flagella basal body P-ring formation protein FlgA